MATALPKGPYRPSSKTYPEDKIDPREVRLHGLVDIAYEKIEELRGLLSQESAILGIDVQDPAVSPILQRQNRLMNQAIKVFNNGPRAPPLQIPRRMVDNRVENRSGTSGSGRKHSVSFKMDMVAEASSPRFPVSAGRTHAERRGHRYEEMPFSPRGNNLSQAAFSPRWNNHSQGAVSPRDKNLSQGAFSPRDKNLSQGAFSPRDKNLNESLISPKGINLSQGGTEHTEQNTGSPMFDSPIQRENFKVDPSWYGSLDRHYAKQRKQEAIVEKRRRHTKTVGSMAGLDHIKKSQELKPDERYEIGLPKVSNFPSSKSSTTIHATLSYPQLPMSWGPTHDFVDGQRLPPPRPIQSSDRGQSTTAQCYPLQRSGITEVDASSLFGRQFVKGSGAGRSCVSLGSGDPTQGPSIFQKTSVVNSKSWFETNLDEGPSTSQLSPVMSTSAMTMDSSSGSGVSLIDGVEGSFSRLQLSTVVNDSHEAHEVNSKSSESNESYSGFGNESTKPFEMSDYYKYSTKYRTQKQTGFKDDSSQGADISVSMRARKPSIHEPLSAEKKKSLIEFFSTPGNPWTDDNESWFNYDDEEPAKAHYSDVCGNSTTNSTLPGAGLQSTSERTNFDFVEPIRKDAGHSWLNSSSSLLADSDKLGVSSKVLHETPKIKASGEQISDKRSVVQMLFSPASQSENHESLETPALQTPHQAVVATLSPSSQRMHCSGENKNEVANSSNAVKDVNGNPGVGPKLPPRLPKDSKLQASNQTYRERSQSQSAPDEYTDENTAWVMDTPTFV